MIAPERIWTASTDGKCHVGFDAPSINYTNEYIRKDASDAAIAAARAEGAREGMLKAAEFCHWNAVGLDPKRGFVIDPWAEEQGGKHPGHAYAAALRAEGPAMTPARKRALQWFHDRGEVKWFAYADKPPSSVMRKKMLADGHLEGVSTGQWKPMAFRLTDKGRRALHGDDK